MADRDIPRGQTHRHGRSRPPTGVRPTDMADRDIPGGQTHRRVCWSRGYSGATGVPCAGAEITPVEPAPGHAGEGSALTPNDTPSWGIEPVPERLRVLGL